MHAVPRIRHPLVTYPHQRRGRELSERRREAVSGGGGEEVVETRVAKAAPTVKGAVRQDSDLLQLEVHL